MIYKACKDCQDRHPACHDKCERYQAEKAAGLEEKTAMIEEYVQKGFSNHRRAEFRKHMTNRGKVMK